MRALDCVDGNPCTEDLCENNACAYRAGGAGVVCRAAVSSCDVAEVVRTIIDFVFFKKIIIIFSPLKYD